VGEVLDLLLGMTDVKIDVRQEESRMRPSDVKVLQSDCSKFNNQTGWQPEIPFERTMRDLLDYWRERV
jgi:GDP-4-dehydro-6-deoxy-D-mannose reductase